jgi:chromosome segregation ATPase
MTEHLSLRDALRAELATLRLYKPDEAIDVGEQDEYFVRFAYVSRRLDTWAEQWEAEQPDIRRAAVIRCEQLERDLTAERAKVTALEADLQQMTAELQTAKRLDVLYHEQLDAVEAERDALRHALQELHDRWCRVPVKVETVQVVTDFVHDMEKLLATETPDDAR